MDGRVWRFVGDLGLAEGLICGDLRGDLLVMHKLNKPPNKVGPYQLQVGAHNSTFRGYNPSYPFIFGHF